MKLPANYNESNRKQRQLIREEYVRQQDGKCHHCGEPLSQEPTNKPPINWLLFPKQFTRYPVHLHHDHETGMTIGAVHAYCNAILWQYHGE